LRTDLVDFEYWVDSEGDGFMRAVTAGDCWKGIDVRFSEDSDGKRIVEEFGIGAVRFIGTHGEAGAVSVTTAKA